MMWVCSVCHDALGCEIVHGIPMMGRCGICGRAGDVRECFCGAAREIASLNRALDGLAMEMRARFIENMLHKGGWQEIPYGFAARKVMEEAGELAEALIEGKSRDWHVRVMKEAADVANFALFIHSRAGIEAVLDRVHAGREGS